MPAKGTTKKTSAKTTKSRKTTSKKVKKEAVKAPEPVAEPVSEPVVESTEQKVEEQKETIEQRIEAFATSFKAVIAAQKAMTDSSRAQHKSLKDLDKSAHKLMKELKKSRRKRGGGNQRANPSGFNKPTKISAELSTFLGVDSEKLMPRTEATKMLHSYIKEHNLQKKSDGRIIVCDKKLQGLLNVPKDVQLSYFNLQTYLSPHFLKSTPAASA